MKFVSKPDKSYCYDECGDGKRIFNDCDDGNLNNGDGCSSTCKIEEYFRCDFGGDTIKDYCWDSRAFTAKVSYD